VEGESGRSFTSWGERVRSLIVMRGGGFWWRCKEPFALLEGIRVKTSLLSGNMPLKRGGGLTEEMACGRGMFIFRVDSTPKVVSCRGASTGG